jgi:hypothetical protein
MKTLEQLEAEADQAIERMEHTLEFGLAILDGLKTISPIDLVEALEK